MPINPKAVGLSATSNLISNTVGSLQDGVSGATGKIGEVDYRGIKRAEAGRYALVQHRYPENIGTDSHPHALMFYIYSHDSGSLNRSDNKTSDQDNKEAGPQERSQTSDDITKDIEKLNAEKNDNNTRISEIDADLDSRIGDSDAVFSEETSDLLVEKSTKNDRNKQIDIEIADLQEQKKRIDDQDPSKIEKAAETNEGTTLAVKRGGNTKLASVVSMYIPAQFDNNTQARYQDTDISSFMTQLARSGASNLNEAFAGKAKGSNLMSMLGGAEAATLEAFERQFPGFLEAAEMMRGGNIRTDRMELAFKGMQKRKFGFDFKFIPKSETEAQQAYDIIKTFRLYMAPRLTGDPVEIQQDDKGNFSAKQSGEGQNIKGASKIYFEQPAFFEVKYMIGTIKNQFPIEFGRCVLESVNVKYGGDRSQFHKVMDLGAGKKGAPPGEITMSLQFSELETIYSERVKQGY